MSIFVLVAIASVMASLRLWELTCLAGGASAAGAQLIAWTAAVLAVAVALLAQAWICQRSARDIPVPSVSAQLVAPVAWPGA